LAGRYSHGDVLQQAPEVLEVFELEREGDAERMIAQHSKIGNCKLLWHGTGVAVAAAITSRGLRIMPHSGGRVGRGIYLANECGKRYASIVVYYVWYVVCVVFMTIRTVHRSSILTYSQHVFRYFDGSSGWYVDPAEDGTAIMFLVEAALGKPFEVKDEHAQQSCSFTKAPKGFDSVVAVGQNGPASEHDFKLPAASGAASSAMQVVLPTGVPEPQADAANSGFYQDEFLVYKESQAVLKYMVKLQL
jgi:poly [ADP-ribose] polymerase